MAGTLIRCNAFPVQARLGTHRRTFAVDQRISVVTSTVIRRHALTVFALVANRFTRRTRKTIFGLVADMARALVRQIAGSVDAFRFANWETMRCFGGVQTVAWMT